jgi:hypothetical protein
MMPRGGQRRQVVIMLGADEWRQLAAQARAAERDPFQQARWLLVQKLRESETTPSEVDEEPERVAV